MIHTDFTSAKAERLDAGNRFPEVVATSRVMVVMHRLRQELGLSAQVLRTLEVLLSCLAPKRNHHMVFASNATLSARARGLSDRSLRRHIASLAEAGLLIRSDSANGKRYSCHNPVEGTTMRFGLDLSPLFARFHDLSDRADAAEAQAQRLAYMKRKLRVLSLRLLDQEPENEMAKEANRLSRRNVSIQEVEASLATLPQITESEDGVTVSLSGSGGQNDRHHPNLSKEQIDKNTEVHISELLTTCKEAQSFAFEPITQPDQVIGHAKMLAPMMGISQALWESAVAQKGEWTAAVLVWLIVQSRHISKPGAYFRSVTTGLKAMKLDCHRMLRMLMAQLNVNCPRTIGSNG